MNEEHLLESQPSSGYIDGSDNVQSRVFYAIPEQPHELCFPMTITVIIPFFGFFTLCFIRDKYVSKRCTMVAACLLFVYSVIATGFVVQYLRTH